MRLAYVIGILIALSPASTLAQGFWEELDGPPDVSFGASIEVHTYIQLGDDTVFACLSNGVVMSLDEGATWERRTYGLPDDHLISLAADSAGTLIASSYFDGAFRSTDAGMHWEMVNQGIETPESGGYPYDIWDVCYSHIDDTWFIASMDSKVHMSTNKGDRWDAITLDTTKDRFRSILCAENGNVVVCGSYGIHTWIRDLKEWRRTGDGAHDMHRASDRIYSAAGYMLTSDDMGETWSTEYDGPEGLYLHSIYDMGEHGLFACVENNFMMSEVFQSQDSGRTWVEVWNLSKLHSYVEAMIKLPSGRMLAGDWYGSMRSDATGKNWSRMLEGLHRVPCRDATLTSDGTLLAATINGLHSIQEEGKAWRQLHERYCTLVQEHASGTILSLAWPGILRSTDNGAAWDTVVLGHNQADCLLQNQNGVLYCGIVDSTMYRSNDAGATWTAGTVTLPYSHIADAVIADDGSLLLLSETEGVLRVDSALTRVDVLLPLSTTSYLFSIALEPQGAIVVSAWNGLFRSVDDGASWKLLPLPDSMYTVPWFMDMDKEGNIFCLFRMYDDPQDYSSYRESALYASTDQGVTWETLEIPQPYQWYTMLEVLSDEKLYVGTRAEGLFRTSETVTSIEDEAISRVPSQPTSIGLQAYPQPARSSVTLIWEEQNGMRLLPRMRSLMVHDCLGRVVDRREVYVAEFEARRIVYDTHGLRPGVYVFTLSGAGTVGRTRILVQR